MYLQSRGSAPGVGDPELLIDLSTALIPVAGRLGLSWTFWSSGVRCQGAYRPQTAVCFLGSHWSIPERRTITVGVSKTSFDGILHSQAALQSSPQLWDWIFMCGLYLVNVDIIRMHSFHQVMWKQTDSYNML